MQRIREEVLRRGLGVVGHISIPAEMPQKRGKFSLPSVEVLALLAQVAQQGSSFFLLPFYSRA